MVLSTPVATNILSWSSRASLSLWQDDLNVINARISIRWNSTAAFVLMWAICRRECSPL